MKQALCAVLLGLIIGIVPPLFAQDRAQESEYYYLSTPIEKIYVHREGYVVTYLTQSRQWAQVYIPHDWFTIPTGKAEKILIGPGSTWPSLTVFYQYGVFSHIRLVLRRDTGHQTWGVVPLYVDISENFRGVNEIHLEF